MAEPSKILALFTTSSHALSSLDFFVGLSVPPRVSSNRISVLTLLFQLPIGRTTSLRKDFSRYWSTVFPAAPEGAGFASGEHKTPRNDPFPGCTDRHFHRQTSTVIENCSALRSHYPAGDGSSIPIFASMSANSCRVRWLSASSNQ